MADAPKPRKRRANGEESRNRILDAAVEIASERGYEATTIALVSKRSGLPASSIYWHFTDKDDLIAAAIERSFGRWLATAMAPPKGAATRQERAIGTTMQSMKRLHEAPDFLRLGLILALERRPEEPRARSMFLQVRELAHLRMAKTFRQEFPGLDEVAARQLATFAMAGADGLFIAKEISGDAVDLLRQFELLATAVLDAATGLSADPIRESANS